MTNSIIQIAQYTSSELLQRSVDTTAVKSEHTIDREMREWDFAAKITRMYTQYSLHIIHNVHTKYIIHSIHKVYTKYTQTIHKVYT